MQSENSAETKYIGGGTLWMCNKHPLTQPINWLFQAVKIEPSSQSYS